MRSQQLLMVTFGAAVALSLIWLLRGTLPLLAIALLYAIATWPLVRAIPTRVPRAIAVATVNLGIAAALIGISATIGPGLFGHIASLVRTLPEVASAVLLNVSPTLRDSALALLKQVEAIPLSLSILRSASSVAGALMLVPVLASYLQIDKDRYERLLFHLVLPEHHQRTREALVAATEAMSAFVRGQVIVSACVGLMVFVVLLACRVPFAGSIALLTTLFDLVPYLGGIAAFVPSLLFAFAAGGVWRAALVGVLLIVAFEVEAQLLSPLIVGARTKLFPSTVIVVLIVGSALFGLMGLYLSVPFTAAAVAAGRVIFVSKSRQIETPVKNSLEDRQPVLLR